MNRTEEKYLKNYPLILNFFYFTDFLEVNAHVDGSRWDDSLKNKHKQRKKARMMRSKENESTNAEKNLKN